MIFVAEFYIGAFNYKMLKRIRIEKEFRWMTSIFFFRNFLIFSMLIVNASTVNDV